MIFLNISEIRSKWEIEYKKGFAKPLILLVLAKKENYPYQITKEIQKMTNGEVLVATSNIYPILKNLKEQSLITEHKDEEKRRVMYSITKNGLTLLNNITESLRVYLRAMQQIIEPKGVEITV